ncbi:MAG: hypothetical protein ACP5XB_03770 [Isosphaeraceae bacterium]
MERAVPVENRARLTAESLSPLRNSLADHRFIKRAVDWLAAHDPPIAPTGMVTRDEFSHDILVPYPGGLWLVYDSS